MSENRVIPREDTTGTITFTLLVNGTEAPNTLEFLSLTTHKEINRIPFARIVLKDGSASAEDFPLSNENILIPGKEVEVQAGYDGTNKTIFKGIIIKHNIKIRENKGAVLCLECRDKAVKTTIGRKSKYFEEITDSDALTQILGDYDVTSNVESTSVTHQELVQYYSSDWDFILSRADVNGLLVIPNDGEFVVKKPKTESPKLSLIYGSTLLEFEAEIDARHQLSSVKSSSWDYKKQEVLEVEGAQPSANQMGNLTESELANVIGTSSYNLCHSGNVSDDELQAWADAKLQKGALSKVFGRAKCDGFADIFPGDTIEFNGVGDRFNGKAFVSGVRQELQEGSWYTSIQFGLAPDWYYNQHDTVDKPSSGLLPGINGLQIGVVKLLSEDPNGEDRIQVVLPIVDSSSNGIWARLASLDAGKERGFVFRPEIGDEVIVGFINDDPRDAVVLGMLHSSKLNAPIPPNDDNHEKGLVTRSGMRVWFDDDKKIITLDTPGGNSIEVNEDTTSIKLEDQNGNKIIMNDSGIEIKSIKDIKINADANIEVVATSDAKVEGVNVELAASAELKADGGAGTKITSSAITEVKGSLVQIN